MSLLRSSLALTAMSGVAALLSAAYLTVVGRMLGPGAYGSFATVMALISLASLVLAPLETGVTKLVARFHAQEAPGRTRTLLRDALRRGGIWLIAIALLSLPLLPRARRALNLESTSELGLFVAYVGVWLLVSILRGALRGDHRFREVGAGLLLESAVRLCAGIAAIWLGAGASGGVGGYLAGMIASALLAALHLRDVFRSEPEPVSEVRLLAVSGSLFFLFLYFQALTTVDMLVAKRALSPLEAGMYGACSTVARLILVGAAPLLNVLFSRVATQHAMGQPIRQLVVRATLATVAFSVAGYAIPWLGGELLLRLLFGAAFVGDVTPLRVLWITTSLLLAQNVVAFSLVAADLARGAWTLALPCVLLIALLARYHGSAVQVAVCGLVAALSGVLPLTLMVLRSLRTAASKS